ncbi:hypothetical protein HRG_004106 [Hirsutella rhossiliensis]|uniref:Uncharacterized protein n=1 Tax=Hirsutella rhossiliensis TaxID=111463 RepID=A0A9P8N399_9HYPO|nr:uncharacterized protein HRG_04106 [Hirsutella rhossiliensis]KAH0966090.1 hypothetical protein HRG_04106 [Hirsutella rhossiliensis]
MSSPTDKPSPLLALAARQQQHVVTQTILRQATTLTTVVTLAPASTVRPDAHIYGAQPGLSSLQLGAILGSIAAVAVVFLAGGICWAHRRKARAVPAVDYTYYYYSDTYAEPLSADSLSSKHRPKTPRYPPPVAEFIPGGARYPTYKAIPIKNPRKPQNLRRVYT